MSSASSPAVPRHFKCDICSLKMGFNSRDAHLAGQKHTKKLRAVGIAPAATLPVTSPQPLASTIETPNPSAHTSLVPAHKFRCAICAIDMNIGSKVGHLAGKKHAQKLGAQTAVQPISATAAPAPPQAQPTPAPVTSSTLPTTVERFNCTICHIKVHVADKGPHLAGKRHKANLAKEATGKGSKRKTAGSSFGEKRSVRKKRRGPPSGGPSSSGRSDNRNDSQESLLALLMDIDTQWGMLPEGGAYKESNHYYGPGIHDYY